MEDLIYRNEKLREENNILKALLENTHTHLAYLDRDFNFVYINEAYASGSGHSKAELVGKNHFAFFPNPENEKLFRECRDTAKPVRFHDKPFQYVDQPERGVTYWDWSLIPVKDSTGTVTSLVFSLTETTKRKKAEDRMRDAIEELESFSYSVSHDLRTPVQAILGLCRIFLEDYSNILDESGREIILRIEKSGKKMNELIDSILSLSRIGRLAISREKINLSRIAEDIVNELKQRDPDRKADISIQSGMEITADASLIKIALTNLINNSWKYTKKNSCTRIEFGSFKRDNQTVFFIKDNGVGFDMSSVKRLFIPFHRLHSDKDFPGTGIGLATVNRIMSRHGGKVWAEAEKGKGATFYFTIDDDGISDIESV